MRREVASCAESSQTQRADSFGRVGIICHKHYTGASSRILAIGSDNLLSSLFFDIRSEEV
jgi:hypothetical protein